MSPASGAPVSDTASASLDAFGDGLPVELDSSLWVLDDDDTEAHTNTETTSTPEGTEEGFSGDDLLIQKLLDESDALLRAEVVDVVDVATLLASPARSNNVPSGTDGRSYDSDELSDDDHNGGLLKSLADGDADASAPAREIGGERDSDEEDVDETRKQLELLRKEQTDLEERIALLQAHKQETYKRLPDADTQDDENLAQLTKAKCDHNLRTELVQLQDLAMKTMRAMLSFAPVNEVRLSLMTPLESDIHLGENMDKRRETILGLRRDKLTTTRKFLEHKAAGLDREVPHNYTDTFERFGKAYSVSFQVMLFDNVSVADMVDIMLQRHLCRDDKLANSFGCVSVREPYDCMHRSFLHQRIITSLERVGQLDDAPIIDSNSVFFSGTDDDDVVVLAIDYVDQDDLHPYRPHDGGISDSAEESAIPPN
ncbi:TPA: hypothetical protein N0F65_008248 [Lagenidium giganteum]|uniref:Uncharacterized protein n=1 Tax=Lagenidium giganteum TaxID=4803 RepID=A0AAV2YJ70_9STRA|nr:TPA: hypothetical protein N0F65_008248 [Lagenidium giganteum]